MKFQKLEENHQIQEMKKVLLNDVTIIKTQKTNLQLKPKESSSSQPLANDIPE